MIHYSVLIPERDAAEAIGRVVPELRRALDGLAQPYEIICIDDGSAQPTTRRLEALLAAHPPLRVLRFDEPRGTSAALTAGLATARGDLLIAVDAQMPRVAHYLPHLIARLSRHDLVIARFERPPLTELWRSVSESGSLLAARSDLGPAEDLFWAARHGAVAGIGLARGAFRLLGTMVARRGYRVCQLRLSEGAPPSGEAYRPGWIERLAGRWLERRFEPHLASEMVRIDGPQPRTVPARFDAARPRYVPQPIFTPLDEHPE